MPPTEAADHFLGTAWIEVGSTGSDDYDSLYESDLASATTSLSESVTNYKYENGRRYHAFREGSWPVANDEKQQNQMDLFHHVYSLRLNGDLYLAPIGDNPQKILDVGTGTGIWAIEIGDMHPSAHVVGNDLSPIQPKWVPPNVQFEVDDCNDTWLHTSDSYDFVHVRALHGAVTDWGKLCKEAYNVVKPGGWIEVAEHATELRSDDGSLPADCPLVKWVKNIEEACEIAGRTVIVGPYIESWLRDAGFQNIKMEVFKLPVGTWPRNKVDKEIGAFNLINMVECVEGVTLQLFTKVLKIPIEETTQVIHDVQNDFRKRNYHMYIPYYVAYAQKPDSSPPPI